MNAVASIESLVSSAVAMYKKNNDMEEVRNKFTANGIDENTIEEVLRQADIQIMGKRGNAGRILLAIGIIVIGLSYPLTLVANIAGVNYMYPLYATVIIGSSLLVWGMAKFF